MKNNLIFLISQPRTGSSYLQIQLSRHYSIHSSPESSFLLKYLYDFNNYDRLSFDTNYAEHSWNEFLSRDTNSIYRQEFRNFIFNIYNNFNISGKKYFLDKSPRYYHIIKNLLHIFPDSKFIILLRNPLAVLNSLLKYHYNDSLKNKLSTYSCHDLFNSLKIFNSLWLDQKKFDNIFFTKYEDLVESPTITLNSLFDFLSLNPSETHNHIDTAFLSSSFVDPNAKKFLKPITKFSRSWLNQITTLQKKNIFLFYINYLKSLQIITDNYKINYFSNLVINKKVKNIPYLLRTNSFFKNSFQFINQFTET